MARCATPPTTLPLERRRVEEAFAGHHELRAAECLVEPSGICDQVEAVDQLGAERGEAACQAAGRAGAREPGDVDAELLPVAGRQLAQAIGE